MDLFELVNNDIKEAMKAREKERLNALRNLKKYFLEAKTAPGANDTLSDADAMKIVQKLVKQGRDTAALYETQNRPDLAAEEMAQVTALEIYLPKQLSEEELEKVVREIVTETGATSMKEMGKVMGIASKRLAGQAEGAAISQMVKKVLA